MVIPAFKRLRQKDHHEFRTKVGYTVRSIPGLRTKTSMVMHTCNSSTEQTEAGRSQI